MEIPRPDTAIVPDERHHFLAQIFIEHGLHVAAMKRVSSLVVEPVVISGIYREKLDLAGVDEVRERADHSLPFQLPLVARAGGEAHQRRAPVPVNDHTQFESKA